MAQEVERPLRESPGLGAGLVVVRPYGDDADEGKVDRVVLRPVAVGPRPVGHPAPVVQHIVVPEDRLVPSRQPTQPPDRHLVLLAPPVLRRIADLEVQRRGAQPVNVVEHALHSRPPDGAGMQIADPLDGA
jgi:hypothetical protein